MSRICINFTIGLIILLLSATTAFAAAKKQPRVAVGNPIDGKDKSMLCQSCHGEDGNSADATVPKLAGQYSAYIVKQMQDYQTGKREDPVMTGMAATVTENQDLLDIAAYFASQKPMKRTGPAVPIDKAGEDKFLGMGCVRCHVLAAGDFAAPRIGGQHNAYVLKQLRAYKSGARTNDPSSVMYRLTLFMEDKDLVNLAHFVAGMQ